MPVDRRAAFQLGLLLLAVPVQFLLTQYFSAGDSNERSFALKRVITRAVSLKNTIFSWEKWEGWCNSIFHYVTTLTSKEVSDSTEVTEEDLAESPAVEVLQQVDPNGYFAGSVSPRSPRPPKVKYRVGQVIRHKKWGYRGVIVGWDAQAKAPESWLREMHPKDKPVSASLVALLENVPFIIWLICYRHGDLLCSIGESYLTIQF